MMQPAWGFCLWSEPVGLHLGMPLSPLHHGKGDGCPGGCNAVCSGLWLFLPFRLPPVREDRAGPVVLSSVISLCLRHLATFLLQ